MNKVKFINFLLISYEVFQFLLLPGASYLVVATLYKNAGYSFGYGLKYTHDKTSIVNIIYNTKTIKNPTAAVKQSQN